MQKLDKILVIGPGSLVGSRFIELLPDDVKIWGAGGSLDENSKVISFSKLDITDPSQVLEIVKNSSADFVINFAGATAVDEIEKTRPKNLDDLKQLEENFAYKVNVLGTRNLIDAARKTGKLPIFISTGFVFDGKNGPYGEDDPIADNPADVSFYAWTKILAEKEVLASGLSYLMIRLSYPYKQSLPFVNTKGRKENRFRLDFARTFLKIYDEFKNGERQSIYPIFSDQTLTPTFIDDLPYALAVLIGKNQKGIFHVTSPEITTPYDFACEVLKVARNVDNPDRVLTKGSITEFQRSHLELAIRPLHGGEKSEKIAKLGFKPTSWKEGIKKAFGN